MTQLNPNDVVRLLVDLPGAGLKLGDLGTIVEVFEVPREAYEVEFLNDDGTEKATEPLTRDQFEVVDQGPWQ